MLFNTKYPIMCVPMNQVSDVNLAIAVQKAGAIPSLSLMNFIDQDRNLNYDLYTSELERYKRETDSDTLVLSVGGGLIMLDKVVKPYLDLGFKHIEMFHWLYKEPNWNFIIDRCNRLEDQGVNIIFKRSTGHMNKTFQYKNMLVKGPEGAGRIVDDALPLTEAFDYCKEHFPESNLLVCGGIHNKEQIKEYLNRGAVAVGLGSLFAMSKESCLSDEVKLKLLQSSSTDLKLDGPLKSRGLFADILQQDDNNLTNSLRTGIHDPNRGVVFMGNVIDYINEVLTVEQIVKNLVDD